MTGIQLHLLQALGWAVLNSLWQMALLWVIYQVVLIAIAFALVTTYIAGWFPARKASRIDPVEIIRGK